jgi:predicted permease
VANLLLARASGRRRELAVRAALGAGRAALVRGLLVESWLLALGGAVLGLLLALWGTDALVAALPRGMPRAQEVQVDGGVLAFTLLLAFLVGTLFGLAPALQLPEGSLHAAVAGAGGASAGPRARRLRRALIGAEVAVSMLLLVGAGLMLRSLQRLQDAPLGFRTDGVASVSLSLAGARYQDPARMAALTRGFVDEVRALPGVEGAALVAFQPLTGSSVRQPFLLAGKPAPPPGERNLAQMNMVTPGYFGVMGIALRRGRDLSSAEGVPGAAPAVVVNEAFVRRFLPGEEPLGQGIGFENPEPGERPFTIVGVVGDVRHDGPGQEAPPQMYFHQVQNTWRTPQLVLRAHGNLAQLAAGVQAAVRRVDPEQAASDFKPLDGLVAGAVAEPRFRTLLLGAFALVALLLAAVGIFGVVSYAVGQRTRELGIRMAIGARGADVVRLVLRGELAPVAVGLALGAVGAWAGTRVLASLLYGVSAQDPLAFAGALGVLAGAALLASWLPARRATRIDPVLALRSE